MPTLLPNKRRAGKSKKGYKKIKTSKYQYMAHSDSNAKEQLLNPDAKTRKSTTRSESGKHYSTTPVDNT